MKTFLEYISSRPRDRSDLTRKELELLFRARDRLQESDLKKDLVDNSGSLEDPHLWVKLPEDVGGGLRVYSIFGSLALRTQKDPKSPPTGPAYKVIGRKTREDLERRKRAREEGEPVMSFDSSFHPDYSAVDRLMGQIKLLIQKMRSYNKKTRDSLFSLPGSTVRFRGFWPDTPTGDPLY